MTLRNVSVVAVSLWLMGAVPAFAAPVLYSFTATLTVSKTTEGTNNPEDPPASPFEDALWFPTIHHGETHGATGIIEYDPTLFDEDQRSGTPMVFINLDQWVFGISSSLGFSAVDGTFPEGDSVAFNDTFPSVISGPLPNSTFFGEDAVVRLNNPSGSSVFSGIPSNLDNFSLGTILYFGKGLSEDPIDGHTIETRLLLSGTIDSIQKVPEPATLSLLALGVVATLSRRRRSSGSGRV